MVGAPNFATGAQNSLHARRAGIYLSTVTLPVMVPAELPMPAVPKISLFRVSKSLVAKLPALTITVPCPLPAAIFRLVCNCTTSVVLIRSVCKVLAAASKYRWEEPCTVREELAEPARMPLVRDRMIRPASRVVPGVIAVFALARSKVPAMARSAPVLALSRLATIKVCSALVKSAGVLPLPSGCTPQVAASLRLPVGLEYKIVEVVSTLALLVQVPPG